MTTEGAVERKQRQREYGRGGGGLVEAADAAEDQKRRSDSGRGGSAKTEAA